MISAPRNGFKTSGSYMRPQDCWRRVFDPGTRVEVCRVLKAVRKPKPGFDIRVVKQWHVVRMFGFTGEIRCGKHY